MDIADSGEFGRRLMALAELYDAKLSPVKVALYFEGLRDLSFEAVATALNLAVRQCKFFPKPAELRLLAVGDVEDAVEAAWMALRAAMKSVGSYSSLIADATLGEAITAIFGSWPQACALELSPEMWAAKRKEFGRVYRVLANRQLPGTRYLTGICEQQNSGVAEWSKYTPVARLEGANVRPLTLAEAEQARSLMAAASHGFARLDGETLDAMFPKREVESA